VRTAFICDCLADADLRRENPYGRFELDMNSHLDLAVVR
jgi:hypothetical protein